MRNKYQLSCPIRIITTEDTEFHGGKQKIHIRTPWYSVVNFLLLGQPTSLVSVMEIKNG